LKRHGSRTFIWRGALGGAVGILLLVIYLMYQNPYDLLAVPYLPLILGFGALLGTVVAVAVVACEKIMRVELGLIPRSFIGVIVPALVAWSYLYSKHETDFAGNPSPQSKVILASLVFGAVVGLPAILADRVHRHKEVASLE
jgi:hypothetical protein